MCFFACISMRPKVWLYSKEVRYADVLIIRRMLSTLGRSTGLVFKKKLQRIARWIELETSSLHIYLNDG